MSIEVKNLLAEAAKLQRDLDNGKIRGKVAVKKAKHRVHYCKAKAKRLSGGKSVAASKRRGKKQDPKQMVLPNFLSQLTVVSIEELAKQRINAAIDARVSEVLAQILPTKAAK